MQLCNRIGAELHLQPEAVPAAEGCRVGKTLGTKKNLKAVGANLLRIPLLYPSLPSHSCPGGAERMANRVMKVKGAQAPAGHRAELALKGPPGCCTDIFCTGRLVRVPSHPCAHRPWRRAAAATSHLRRARRPPPSPLSYHCHLPPSGPPTSSFQTQVVALVAYDGTGQRQRLGCVTSWTLTACRERQSHLQSRGPSWLQVGVGVGCRSPQG
jgi:hypothetical protein